MKIARFRCPRDPVVAYAVLVRFAESDAKLDAARINDLDQRIEALQRQLKSLQRGDIRSTDTETPSGS